jgi:hypothetical protein
MKRASPILIAPTCAIWLAIFVNNAGVCWNALVRLTVVGLDSESRSKKDRSASSQFTPRFLTWGRRESLKDCVG